MASQFDIASLNEIPGIKLVGTCNAQITLGDQALENLRNGSASLTLVINQIESKPDIHIEGFTGRLYLRLVSKLATVKFGNLRDVQADITFYPGGQIEIGDDTSINGLITGLYEAEIKIGEDCMLSHDVHMQPHNQHGIIDLETKKMIKHKRNIFIGDHVWVGRAVSLLPGITIGNGAIIGANSVVTKDVDANSAVAGYPARVVRENCTWSRSSIEIDAHAERYLGRLT